MSASSIRNHNKSNIVIVIKGCAVIKTSTMEQWSLYITICSNSVIRLKFIGISCLYEAGVNRNPINNRIRGDLISDGWHKVGYTTRQ